MNSMRLMAATAALLAACAAACAAPTAKEIRGASTYVEIDNEPAPKLFVDQPLP